MGVSIRSSLPSKICSREINKMLPDGSSPWWKFPQATDSLGRDAAYFLCFITSVCNCLCHDPLKEGSSTSLVV